MSNKTDVLSFDELARFYGLSLMTWDEDNYASEILSENNQRIDLKLSTIFNKIHEHLEDSELTDSDVFDKLESLRVVACFDKELVKTSPKMLKVIDGYISYLQESLK